MSQRKIQSADWYDFPQCYDLAFYEDTPTEVAFIEAAFAIYATRKVNSVLEAGCGTGRLLYPLTKNGYRTAGFDRSASMLEFAKNRIGADGLSSDLRFGEMSQFDLGKQFDAVLNWINTFRHLQSEKEALSHLKCVAKHLRPGGVFLLGMHLLPPDADPNCTERWRAARGELSVHFTLRVLEADPRRRLEKLRLSLLQRNGDAVHRVRSEFTLRTYNASQAKKLFRKVPELELIETFDFWYEINEPQAFDDVLSDAVFIFRKRP